jgi:hypothetical protein
MTAPRQSHTATLLTTGKVLIAGGYQLAPPQRFDLASAELYDPTMGGFTTTGNMVSPRAGHTATLLPSGKVLIAGGGASGPPPLATAELYDPATGSFTRTGEMTTPRVFHSASLLRNGKVLITGGYSGDKVWAASAEVYDPSTGAFTRTGDMISGRSQHTATLLANGTVLIEGEDQKGFPSAEIYDPDTGTFSLTGEATQPPGYGYSSAAALLTSGKVLLSLTYESFWCDQAKLYDPTAGTFAPAANMSLERYYGQTATPLPDGKVLIVGTHDYDKSSATADLHDPVTGTFKLTGDTDPGREWHTATLLPDGTVLLSGGVHFIMDSSAFNGFRMATLDSAWVYHPPVSTPSPVLFSLTGDGQGQGAIQHADTYDLVTADNPAVAGEIIVIYCTGLIEGGLIPPQITIGGRMAEVLFFGGVPGSAGLNQVNVRVPSGVAPGPAVSVRLNYLGRPSNEVTIGVR